MTMTVSTQRSLPELASDLRQGLECGGDCYLEGSGSFFSITRTAAADALGDLLDRASRGDRAISLLERLLAGTCSCSSMGDITCPSCEPVWREIADLVG